MKNAIVHVEGAVGFEDLERIFAAAGYHLRIDPFGRIVACRIPAFLAKAPVHIVAKRKRLSEWTGETGKRARTGTGG